MWLLFSVTMFKTYLFVLNVVLVQNFYIPKGDLKNDTAEEIQNALCTITTKEFEASANATITRQLKGVCTSNELNLKIDKLQTRILQEIDDIKYILEINGFIPEVDLKNAKLSDNVVYGYKSGNVTGDLPRIEEILMYNNTIMDTMEGSKYFYYWKIHNTHQMLGKRDMYWSSPKFQVLGHNLRLHFYPNHIEKNHFGIELRPDSPGFLKKHKISILNQLNDGSDIDSGILYGISDKKLLHLPEKSLEMEGFILEDALIIKLEILLNS